MKPPEGLPYAHLNLRTNPFRTLDPSERARVAVVEVEELARWLVDGPGRPGIASGGRILQLVGRGGCGKTTWLEALHRRLPGAARVAWSATGGWPSFPVGRRLLVDDAHELRGRHWRALRRRDVLVLATRTDLGRRLARLPGEIRSVRIEDFLTRDRMRRMITRRMQWARRGPGSVPVVTSELLTDLRDRHGPDVRAVYGELYGRIPAHPRTSP